MLIKVFFCQKEENILYINESIDVFKKNRLSLILDRLLKTAVTVWDCIQIIKDSPSTYSDL